MPPSDSNDNFHRFDSSYLLKLPLLPTNELNKIEQDLADEFKSASKEYVISRLSRINHVLDELNYHIRVFTENDLNWSRIYNFEIETISNMKTNTEDYILLDTGLIRSKREVITDLVDYEEEFREIIKNLQSPLEFDRHFIKGNANENNIPFAAQFDKILDPFKKDLEISLNEMHYQNNLVSLDSKRNAMIIWKQYYQNLLNGKRELIDRTYLELNELYKEYYEINANEMNCLAWKRYYRSLVSPTDLKRVYEEQNQHPLDGKTSHDSYYYIDNIYYPKNKVELTDAKYRDLESLKTFEVEQKRNYQNNDQCLRLDSCSGLNNDEIESDLKLLRSDDLSETVPTEASPLDPMELSPAEPIDKYGSEYDKKNSEHDVTFRRKYRRLLEVSSRSGYSSIPSFNSSSTVTYPNNPATSGRQLKPFVLPEIPPIERFQNFNRRE
ncbi:uncharacterized protein PRCAT00001589001 [Priceomyces carsonii]|uniref:uncharacterized protein n=1 Tax=Priceomyces carsonii TaxID=28549 RepID=UPI002EDA915D|nr:unnamed protein product [Priceomyces carsonii]